MTQDHRTAFDTAIPDLGPIRQRHAGMRAASVALQYLVESV
jgi:hypothetical protein